MKKHPKPQAGIHWSVAALCAFVCASGAHGAVTHPIHSELEPTIVVSTRTPLGPERVSPSVTAITRKEIMAWQDTSLTDSLQREPGMVLWSNGGLGNLTSLSIRGTESNHSSIFVDGRRLSPGFGNQYDLGFLRLGAVSSLEIQRGPSSVQYGSSNIGGVIDKRLRSGLGLGGHEGSIFAEAGSNNYQRSGLDARGGSDVAGYSLSGSWLSTDNERPNDAYKQQSFVSRLDYQLSENLLLELVATGFDNQKQLPGNTLNPTPSDYQDTSSWLVSPGIRYLSDELSVHLFYSRAERNSDIFEINPAYDAMWTYLGDFPVSNRIEVISDEINLQVDYSLPDQSLLSVGAVFRNDDILNTNIDTTKPLDPANPYAESFQQIGTYAQLLWLLGPDTELRTGLRHDQYSDYADETTGNLMLIHHLRDSRTSLFAKVATAYAPPSPVDLAYDSDTSTPLDAESSQAYEIGINQSLMNDRLQASVVLFRNEIDELLSFEPSTFDTINIEEATTEGMETSLSYKLDDHWQFGAGYTYLRAVSNRLNDPRTSTSGDAAKDVPLARRPRHLAQLSARYRMSDEFSCGLQAIGQFTRHDIDPSSFLQQEAEDIVVFRLVSEWQVSEDWTLTGRIENLLDQDYATADGYPALGRTIYLGAKMDF